MRNGKEGQEAFPNSLRDEAMELLLRVKFGAVSATALEAWRRRSVRHEAALVEAETLWQRIGETQAAAEFAAATPPPLTGRSLRRKAVGRRALLTGALAAGGAAVVLGSGVLGPLSGFFADYATGIGERRDVALPDGSVACLNTASALSFTIRDHQRRAALASGECLFEVAADQTRPFVAEAMNGEVRTSAATFSLRRLAEGVRVLAVEGRVEVAAAGDFSDALTLSAGQTVTYGGGRILSAIEAVDVEAAAAWRRGKLIFNQRPLAEVVAELQRYRHGRILIVESALADLPVTGVFDLADPDATLAAIEAILPVEVTRLPLLTLLS